MGSSASGLLNQVSTDTGHPPAYFKSRIGMNERPLDIALQNKLHPDVKPLEIQKDAEAVYEAALALAKSQFTNVEEDPDGMRIECSDVTKLM
eukprot:scaffold21959_cov45-Prasinocladus_malaysianus.AAC.1